MKDIIALYPKFASDTLQRVDLSVAHARSKITSQLKKGKKHLQNCITPSYSEIRSRILVEACKVSVMLVNRMIQIT